MADIGRGAERSASQDLYRLFPTWKGNLVLFGVLILIVLGYFFWQIDQARRAFMNNVRDYSSMLAGVIELNAKGALLSEEIVQRIMGTFLGNTARFADYLDSVEPFSSDELASFAAEAGLAGIRITGPAGFAEGPLGWLPDESFECPGNDASLRHLPESHLYFLAVPRVGGQGCVFAGLTAKHIEKLHEQAGLPHLMATLPGLAGIRHARIEKGAETGRLESGPKIAIVGENGAEVAESRLPLGNDVLVVGLDTESFFSRVERLQYEFVVLSAILAFLGSFFSWLLYRYQNLYLEKVREFERQMGRQREDAALGQAAASITHEIRNPLNAISMGLQRMQWEIPDLPDEYRQLLSNMQQAVKRTNGIVTNIRRYARPLEPAGRAVNLKDVVDQILSLYGPKCEERGIEVLFETLFDGLVNCDPDLMAEVVENLVKNAIEAQDGGGYIRVVLDRKDSDAAISIENSGFTLAPDEAGRILEPYFTTKTRGTGLGLAIAGRIVGAHGGRLELHTPSDGVIMICACIPILRNQSK